MLSLLIISTLLASWPPLTCSLLPTGFLPTTPGKLILVRHGQSIWNANKTFTGWCDPDLSKQGLLEAEVRIGKN